MFLFASMGERLLSWLQSSGGWACYGIMLLLFLVGSIGFPLPEEAVLAMGGYLAATGAMSLLGAYLFGYTVVLLIDCVLYEVGRRAGPAFERSRWGKRIKPERLAAAHDWFARYGVLTVVIARFVMGTRISVFLLAGALGVPRRTYLIAVGISGLFSNAIPVLLGYYLADHIDEVVRGIDTVAAWSMLGVVVVLVVLYLLYRRWRARVDAAESEESA